MSATCWQFEALDRLFFRDGRPMNQGEMTWVESQFPPTGRTLQGAVRTAVLQHAGADFKQFRQGNAGQLNAVLGNANSLGVLKLTGPFLLRNSELLFPAPLDIVKTESGGFDLLCVNEQNPIRCDLGRVLMPRGHGPGIKTLDGRYLTKAATQGYLAGDLRAIRVPTGPQDDAATLWPLFPGKPEEAALADREPKIGLERDDATRTAQDAMLYSIAFVRPRDKMALALVVDGLDDIMQPPSYWMQPLGGEAKLAGLLFASDPPKWPDMPELKSGDGMVRFKLVLTTPALFDGDGRRWRPDGFSDTQKNGVTIWTGRLNGVACDIVAACIGKPQKIGGWDMAMNNGIGGPRPLTCHVPAGSVYFCRAKTDQLEQIRRLHGNKIGLDTEYGFGHLLVGTW